MQDWSDITNLPDDFDGRVRLFPLPGLVLFPHAMQPLHVFEPRYCDMLQDALSADHLIAMATLAMPGDKPVPFELQGVSQPPIRPIICMGRIMSHTELEGDRHNILLVGTKRARVVSEIDVGRSFRMAEVDVLDDIYPVESALTRNDLKSELLEAFAAIIPPSANVQKNLHDLMAGQMGLGPITDIVSYTLPFDVDEKIALLGEADVDRRARLLITLLESGKIELHSISVEEQTGDVGKDSGGKRSGKGDRFPPPFSVN